MIYRPVSRLTVAVLALLLLAGTAAAQQLNIRTVNMEKIFDSYYKTYKAKAELRREEEAFNAYRDQEIAELKQLQEQLRGIVEGMEALNEEGREKAQAEGQALQRRLMHKDKALREYVQQEQKRVSGAFSAKRDAIVQEIIALVDGVAKENNLDMVIDISGRTTNNIPPLVYTRPEWEITDQIIEMLNAGHEHEIPAGAEAAGALEPELEAVPAE